MQFQLGGTQRAPLGWRGLADAQDETGYCLAWLSLQCPRIPNATTAVLLWQRAGEGAASSWVGWPTQDGSSVAALLPLAERSFREQGIATTRDLLTAPTEAPGREYAFAVPLGVGDQKVGAIALRLAVPPDPEECERLVEQLRWGGGWLEALQWAGQARTSSADAARAMACLDLMALAGEQPTLAALSIAVANTLAARFGCDRVCIGLCRQDGGVRLAAISHSASFKRRSSVVDAIESAMEEAVDQGALVSHPPLPETELRISMAHRALTETVRTPGAAAMSAVLVDSTGRAIGAISFEYHSNLRFDAEALRLAEAVASLLGPMIGLQKRASRLIGGRLFELTGKGLRALLGPGRPALKLATLGGITLIVIMALAVGEHRVTAKAVLEPEVQRAAVAPFDGFVRSAPVRAGDTVKKGDLLAALDDRDMLLDQAKWRAELDKLQQRLREALAKHERTTLVVLEAQIQQAQAQAALADEKLARAQIAAPFDGIVVAGDLSQKLGSPVEKGKTLFEVAPLDAYRLIIHVDERDIRYVAAGQTGTVALAGMPWAPISLALGKITPVTVSEEGRNTFRVEAQVTTPGARLRPGMEGVAKIGTGEQSLLWIWTRSVIEWLRLAAWKHLP
jgi:RND family efflux transporter MFP subunit